MSQWTSTLSGPWANNTGDVAIGHANWTTDAVMPNESFNPPTLTTNKSDGAEILQARVAEMLAGGFKGITNTDVLANPDAYFINNYWAGTDVEHYGHINGAYRILPLTLANNEVEFLDSEKTIVTYCWTGQTSSMLTAYLNVLGYDAVSLKFGANGMIFSDLESHKYSPPSVDLPVVTE
jgi:hypothetical protein